MTRFLSLFNLAKVVFWPYFGIFSKFGHNLSQNVEPNPWQNVFRILSKILKLPLSFEPADRLNFHFIAF